MGGCFQSAIRMLQSRIKMIEDKELAKLFKAESAEHLAKLDDGLLHLEKNPTDQAILEEVFRESHSMKGAARMLGLPRIESAAHGLESILNAARKGETPLTADVIEHMNTVLSDLRQLVREELAPNADAPQPEIRNPEPEATPQPEIRNPEPEATPQPATRNPKSAATPQPATRNPKSAATPQPAIRNPKSENAPQPEAPNPESDTPQSNATRPTEEAFRIETVRIETRKLDDLLTLVGELSVIEGRMRHRLSMMDTLQEQWALLERSHKNGKADSGSQIAELGKGIVQARDAFHEDGTRLESTVNTLQEQVHGARLLPLSTVFALFPRMVRDLAKAQEKEVNLVVEGGDIGVDKRILEEMKDPLMHLLRNAIDHGIETPAVRESQGKPRTSTIWLRAVQESGRVLLEVRDDGRGLDLESIRHTALKNGMHDAATLAAMSAKQIQQLIFSPGFTTSTFITELSGRGVGLDVVRANVEHLKGDIRMESVAQQGTLMQVRLPLSLATTRLLLAGVGDRLFGVPIEFVHTSRGVREEEIFTIEGHPAFELDGQPVIAPRLAELLGLPAANQGGEAVCIVLQVGNERFGVRVDQLLSEEEVVTKPLGAPLVRVRNVSGLTILGNGEICAVLNPADLVRSAHRLATSPDRNKPVHAKAAKPVILLAEDSALVRAMEKRILEDAGYEVVATVDGMDAFNTLGQRPFAAVVSDIMMPNMDGLTLTARIREEPRFKDLPVILVTTLSSDEDKRRGLEAGADAYIFKPSFDQRVLVDTLKRLI